jgi:hypothetical protein
MTLAEQFTALNALLVSTRQYWQCTAFDFDAIPWPELESVLTNLTDQQVAALDNDQNKLYQVFGGQIEQLQSLAQLCEFPKTTTPRSDYPFWISNGVKGRKFEQLQDFVAALPKSTQPVLEWCAGKGHLGRMLAFNGAQNVHSLELQPQLCEQGQQTAKQQGLAMRFSQTDVLNDATSHFFAPNIHAVALHACGGLHQALMQQASRAKVKNISFSPCCYHLFTPEPYVAMSPLGKTSALNLTHRDLKLALQETVTAPSRIAKLRKTEVEWRLGFDALRKSITNEQYYVSIPSVSKAIFSGSFKSFCAWAAAQKSLKLPQDIDYGKFLSIGEARIKVTDRIELVRHVFRRAIEVWLVLDRALYLQQQGYQVSIKTFCEKQLTPRNLLILANLPSSTKEEMQ